MKLKLAALLAFSQAAKALVIDKTNYKQHLCDQGIFTPTVVTHPVTEYIPPHLDEMYQTNIKSDYQVYCLNKFYYDEAIENERKGTWRTHKPCAGNPKDLIEPSRCVEKQGIYYAQLCEKLKQDRDNMPAQWNAVMPKLVSCNNM